MILARPPTFSNNATSWFATPQGQGQSQSKVILAVKAGYNAEAVRKSVEEAFQSSSSPVGVSVKCPGYRDFNEGSDCVAMDNVNLYPRDIMTSSTPFSELARWVFYGRRGKMVPKADPSNPIPR
jgi:hypothetical protein